MSSRSKPVTAPYWNGLGLYLAEGKRAPARKDLERIMAEDSDYEGLGEMLAQVDG